MRALRTKEGQNLVSPGLYSLSFSSHIRFLVLLGSILFYPGRLSPGEKKKSHESQPPNSSPKRERSFPTHSSENNLRKIIGLV